MILTDDFVYIHMPGTGGTFVTRAIHEAYFGRKEARQPVDKHKHGTCNDIPPGFRHLPIVSNIRSPFDRYVALYEYGWWRKNDMDGISRAQMQRMYPHYPDLSFAEFVELASAHFAVINPPDPPGGVRPGFLTEQFIRFYFRRPDQVVGGLSCSYLETARYRPDMYDVRFLRTDRLTGDVSEFFESLGFGPDVTARVRALGRVSPPRVRLTLTDLLRRNRARRSERDWRRYYTPALIELVRRREWFLLGLFPELDAPTD